MDTLDELEATFKEGRLTKACRKDLERYAMAVCSTGATHHPKIGGARLQQIAETVRLLLLVQISKESARASLYVGLAALAVGIAGAAAPLIG